MRTPKGAIFPSLSQCRFGVKKGFGIFRRLLSIIVATVTLISFIDCESVRFSFLFRVTGVGRVTRISER